MISRPLQRLMVTLPVRMSRRGRMKRSMRARRSAPVQGRLEVLGGEAALHQEGGQPGHRLRVMPMPMKEDQQANGVLTPGMETGSRKGTVSSTQNSSMPCSPTQGQHLAMYVALDGGAVALRVSESVLWGL